MIRVGLVQALIPHYREPVFKELASREGIDLTMYADLGARHGSLHGARSGSGFTVIDAKERYIGPLLVDPATIRAARGGHDVLVMSWRTRSLLMPTAIRMARRRGAAVVVWGHGYSKYDTPRRTRMRMRVARDADAYLTYDPVTAERLVEGGLDSNRVFCAPNAIDQGPIENQRRWWLDRPDELVRFQQEHRIDPEKTLVFISRIEPDKRLDILIEAMKHARAADPSMTLVVIGDGSAREQSEDLARRLGVEDGVRFVGPIYEEKRLAAWCLSSFCFAYPVAIGLSAMHAFGYGLPVVTSDDIGGHNPEIHAIRPGHNGLFYKDGRVEDLAAKLLQLSRDRDMQHRMSQEALGTVTGPDGWTLTNMVDGFERCIRAVARMRGKD